MLKKALLTMCVRIPRPSIRISLLSAVIPNWIMWWTFWNHTANSTRTTSPRQKPLQAMPRENLVLVEFSSFARLPMPAETVDLGELILLTSQLGRKYCTQLPMMILPIFLLQMASVNNLPALTVRCLDGIS